jgi:hypothetical protein
VKKKQKRRKFSILSNPSKRKRKPKTKPIVHGFKTSSPFKLTKVFKLKKNSSDYMPVYAIKFCPYADVFAAGIGDQVMIFECTDSENGSSHPAGIKLVCAHRANEEDEESIFALAWSFDPEDEDCVVLAFGGKNRVVRVVWFAKDSSDCGDLDCTQMKGHSK